MPESGFSVVTVNIKRRDDNQEQNISFELRPITIDLPSIPTTIYPGVEYTLSPNFPASITDASSFIKDKDRVRSRASNNQAIKFVADSEDVGKTLVYERYIAESLTGQRHSIKVIDFPPPEISRISLKDKNEVVIETIAYGKFGRYNNNIKDVVITGNGQHSPTFGNTHTNPEDMKRHEQFIISPKNYNSPFVFEVYLIDQHNRRSIVKKWGN